MPSTRTVDTKSGRICEAELGDPGSAQWRWGDLLLGKFSRNTVLRPDMYPNQQRHLSASALFPKHHMRLHGQTPG